METRFKVTLYGTLIANGISVVTVSRQLGHHRVIAPEDIYVHLIEKNKEQATECITSALLQNKRA